MFLMLGINKEWLAKNLATDQSVMEASLDARVRRASISSFMKYLSNQMLNVDDKIEENLNLDIVGCDSQTIERLKYSDLNTPIKVYLEGELSIIFHDRKSRDIKLIAGALCDSFVVKKTIKYKLKTKVYLQCSFDINNELFIKENVSSLVSVNDMNDLVFNEKN